MKVTVLGSSGQVGAYLTEYLRKLGHSVTGLDVVNGPEQDLTIIPNPVLEAAIADSDYVFFLAFDVGGSRYLKKYQHTYQFINNNTRLMANVFGLLEKYKTPFVFASSQMSNMSYSPYGVLKNVGEMYTKALGGLIVKFWNVYGIERDLDKAHVITDFIRKGMDTGVISMMTDGQEQREFLYAEDCCAALTTVMNNHADFTSNDNLHITSFEPMRIINIAEIIMNCFHEAGRTDVTVYIGPDKDTVQQDRKNQADRYILNWWQPQVSIREGIAKVFEEMYSEQNKN
jgi:nucleoside-diphosphate-sugar epimerase